MTDKEVKKRLKTLSKIDKILQKANPTGKEVGTLFLLSACEEVKNTLAGHNIAPVTTEQLQNKVNAVISTEDLIELNSYINFMNSIKSSYNLCTAYKVKVKYRLAGYTLILERLQHIYECVELSNGADKYTTALKKQLKTLTVLPEIEKTVMNEATNPYLHNVLINEAITAYNLEELKYFLLDTSDIETEVRKCKTNCNKFIKLISGKYDTYGTDSIIHMNIKDVQPTPDQIEKIRELVKSVRNYNFYSPVLRHLYFTSDSNKTVGDIENV